jgi:hypothetical protein
MSEPNELNWHPQADDPAFKAGYGFVERNQSTADGHVAYSPWWYGWMVRQAFWCGVKWAREHHHSLPISGKVLEDGRIEWREVP